MITSIFIFCYNKIMLAMLEYNLFNFTRVDIYQECE